MGKKSEVEIYQQQSAAAVPGASFDLQQWGRDAELVASVAANLVKTSFVPQSYAGRALEATAAILTGQEIGLKPMASLRSIDVIQGTPAMRAVALRALVQAAGHEIWTEESTATRAVVAGRRRGSENVERSTWDVERARGLNLLSKDNWKKQPIAMLLARATSECVRLVAADVLLGIPYSVEEIQDLGVAEGTDGADAPRKAPAKTTARRKPLPAAPPEPALPDETPYDGGAAAEQEAAVAQAHQLDEVASVEVAKAKPEEPPALTDAELEADAARAEERVFAEARAEEPALDWGVQGMDR